MEEVDPGLHKFAHSHRDADHAEHSIALSAAEKLHCGGAVGSVLSSRALQQLFLRKRGILHPWLVQIRDKPQTLQLKFVFHFQEVKRKTLNKITHPAQTVSCFHSSVIFNPMLSFGYISQLSGETSKQSKDNCLLEQMICDT